MAEPYKRSPWEGAQKWANLNKTQVHYLKLQDKAQVTANDKQNINITITLDNSTLDKKDDPSGAAWMFYGLTRASWQGDRFKKAFPNEPKYRRTLKEEAESLDGMVKILKEPKDFEKNKSQLDPALLELIRIHDAGFLEPFVLLNRADNEIAQDYPAYRDLNRDKIRAYLDQFVVPKVTLQ